jgi:hypothetical protein
MIQNFTDGVNLPPEGFTNPAPLTLIALVTF